MRNDLEADKQYPPVHTLREVSAFFSLANFEAHASQVTCNTSTNGFSSQKIVVIDKLSRANLEFTPQMIVSLGPSSGWKDAHAPRSPGQRSRRGLNGRCVIM